MSIWYLIWIQNLTVTTGPSLQADTVLWYQVELPYNMDSIHLN